MSALSVGVPTLFEKPRDSSRRQPGSPCGSDNRERYRAVIAVDGDAEAIAVESVDDRSLSDEDLEDLIYIEPTPAAITYSTQDLSIDGLVKRMNRRSMRLPSLGEELAGRPRIALRGHVYITFGEHVFQ
jgi:hypothetical protein